MPNAYRLFNVRHVFHVKFHANPIDQWRNKNRVCTGILVTNIEVKTGSRKADVLSCFSKVQSRNLIHKHYVEIKINL